MRRDNLTRDFDDFVRVLLNDLGRKGLESSEKKIQAWVSPLCERAFAEDPRNETKKQKGESV